MIQYNKLVLILCEYSLCLGFEQRLQIQSGVTNICFIFVTTNDYMFRLMSKPSPSCAANYEKVYNTYKINIW
jgi:hypothetical protein